MKTAMAIVGLVLGLMASGVQASFFGRDASNQADGSCTALGTGGTTKCTSFYDSTLNITILNNWNIGSGIWDGSASPSATSAQGIAGTAGFNATGLSGWVLPTGNGDALPGATNQYLSIWYDVGGSFQGLRNQFDGVQTEVYWSGTEYREDYAWLFDTTNGNQNYEDKRAVFFAVAVRSGDVADAQIPAPATLTLLGLGLAGIGAARRKQA